MTRDLASERSANISVSNYAIDLDLTDGSGKPGEKTFRSSVTIAFSAEPGSSSFVDLIAEKVHSATLNGEPVDLSAYTEEDGLALAQLAEQNTLEVVADCLYSHTPGRVCTDSSTPPTTPYTSTHSSRRPTPNACSRASISRT